jgi:hypothetical protein
LRHTPQPDAVAIGIGVIPIAVPSFYDQFPSWFQTIFDSGISSPVQHPRAKRGGDGDLRRVADGRGHPGPRRPGGANRDLDDHIDTERGANS